VAALGVVGAFIRWIKDNIVVLQFIAIVIGGGIGLYEYWQDKNESRRISARELALEHIVVDGFLAGASEIEAAGSQLASAWMYVGELRVSPDPNADLLAFQKGLLTTNLCRQMIYDDNTHLAEGTARIRMLDGDLYYAIFAPYEELVHWMRVLALDPPKVVFASNPQSMVNLAQNFHHFAADIAAKAAEILSDDDQLSFSTKQIRGNGRFAQLIEVCKQFTSRHKAYVECSRTQDNQQGDNKKLQELNNWMVQVINSGKVRAM
jgi:hypothetical protein